MFWKCLPFIQNPTNSSFDHETKDERFVNSIELVILFISIIFIAATNLALIVGLKKTNKTLTISHKLYIYLSLSDVILGLIGLPYITILELVTPGDCSTYTISLTIDVYSFLLSSFTFSLISIIRNFNFGQHKPVNKIDI